MSRGIATTGFRYAAGLFAVTGLVLTGCDKPATDSQPGAKKVTVQITDSGCTPSIASVPAGPVDFQAKNTNATKVTEVELLHEGIIVGEKENLTPGLSGTFAVHLNAGKYQLYCPNAKADHTDFTVTGQAVTPHQDPAVTAALNTATTDYRTWVLGNIDQLMTNTKTFTDAIRAGNADQAKSIYPVARRYYEQIEPIAETFGDLDPAIDARIDDVSDPNQWTGYHRLEKALWQDNSLAAAAPLADKLDADVATLKSRVQGLQFQPAQLANGATSLLDEVGSKKITGEEDRYSHTDFFDFQANLDGARKAFDLLTPALTTIDPQLVGVITRKFDEANAALAPYRNQAGFVSYNDTTVTDTDRRTLTQKIDALAEPLSHVASKVAQ